MTPLSAALSAARRLVCRAGPFFEQLRAVSSHGAGLWVTGLALGIMTAIPIFRSDYLPLIDWSNHLALITLFGRKLAGDELPCMTWGMLPGPYFLFYLLSVVGSVIMGGTLWGTKLVLWMSVAALYPASIYFTRVVGRDPALAVVAPFAAFGYGFGYGFASFIFSLPIFVWALARVQLCLARDPVTGVFLAITAAINAVLLISHGLTFLMFVVLAGWIALVSTLTLRRWAPLLRISTTLAPALLFAGAMIAYPRLAEGRRDVGRIPDRLFEFRPLERLAHEWRGDLLFRWNVDATTVTQGLMLLSMIVLVLGLIDIVRARIKTSKTSTTPERPQLPAGLVALPGLTLVVLGFFGPETIMFPLVVWRATNRFASVGALLLFLALPARLGPLTRAFLIVVGLSLQGSYQLLLDRSFNEFHSSIRSYDEVRRLVGGPRSVVGYSEWSALPVQGRHQAMTGLYFYHMLDGADFCPFMFDIGLYPIHRSPSCTIDRRPFDYALAPPIERSPEVIVVRGPHQVARMDRSPDYQEVGRHDGWVVYRREGLPR